MIVGLGLDILVISRMQRLIENRRFLNRVFTAPEQERIRTRGISTAAGLFCAKEAFFKAAGCGIFTYRFVDAEVVWDERGKPGIRLHGSLAKAFPECFLHLSITHDGTNAAATVIIEST